MEINYFYIAKKKKKETFIIYQPKTNSSNSSFIFQMKSLFRTTWNAWNTLKSTFFIFNAIFISGIAFRNCILFPFSTNREILLQGKEELVPCALPEVDEEQGWEEALADEGAGG